MYNKIFFSQKFVKYSNSSPTKLITKLITNSTIDPHFNNAKSYPISYLLNSSINLKALKNQNKLLYIKGYSKFDNVFTEFNANYVNYSNLNKLFSKPLNFYKKLNIYYNLSYLRVGKGATSLHSTTKINSIGYRTITPTQENSTHYKFKFSNYSTTRIIKLSSWNFSNYAYNRNIIESKNLINTKKTSYNVGSINLFSKLCVIPRYTKNLLSHTSYNPSPNLTDQLKFYSRSGLSFIVSNIGLFFSINQSKITYINSIKFNFIYKFKKVLYTFSKPNTIKNTLLRRNSSITLFNLIFKSKNYNKLSSYHSFLNKNPSVVKSVSKLNNSNYNNLLSKDYSTNISTNLSNPNDIRLPRVRFKPGYQRLWRESRLALKELLGLKFIYQKQLTKYLIRFYSKASISFFVKNELSLDKIVIYSRILPDLYTYNLFFNSKQVFLNGFIPSQTNTTCVVSDFIQLIVSKWYYVFFRWILNWVISRFRKTKRLIYRKGLSSRYKVLKARKQRSFNVPNWIFYSKYDFSDVKPFIEVDYFSLSFFVIYEPYINYYSSQSDFILPNVNIYRLYNWKYIT